MRSEYEITSETREATPEEVAEFERMMRERRCITLDQLDDFCRWQKRKALIDLYKHPLKIFKMVYIRLIKRIYTIFKRG